MASSTSAILLALSSSLLVLCFLFSEADAHSHAHSVPLVKGLSWNYHHSWCPNLEKIIRTQLKGVFRDDKGQAAGLLRLHFHDCFVQGCDGSVLLDGSHGGPSEQTAPPNLSLRKEAFKIVEALRRTVHSECGRVVSCADILALAARDSVFLLNGPYYEVPLGRKDGLNFATQNVTLANIPPPFDNATAILSSLATKNFDPTDVVALSGAHTIGNSHCTSFTPRLYPTVDPTLDESYASHLKEICPAANSNDTTFMDVRSPFVFDNKYYLNLIDRKGLFTSDQDLFSNELTRDIVKSFATDQELFFEKFVRAMTKMGQLSVLTGGNGEVRAHCWVRNPDNKSYFSYLAEEEEEVDEESRAELR